VDLVVHQVSQLQDVDVPHHHRAVVGLTGSPVVEGGLTVQLDQALAVDRLGPQVGHDFLDRGVPAGPVLLVPVGPVKHRRGHVDGGLGRGTGLLLDAAHRVGPDTLAIDLPTPPGAIPEVSLQHLPDVHP